MTGLRYSRELLKDSRVGRHLPPKCIAKTKADSTTEMLKVSSLKFQVEPARLVPAVAAITKQAAPL
jgi:hypothetical protein